MDSRRSQGAHSLSFNSTVLMLYAALRRGRD